MLPPPFSPAEYASDLHPDSDTRHPHCNPCLSAVTSVLPQGNKTRNCTITIKQPETTNAFGYTLRITKKKNKASEVHTKILQTAHYFGPHGLQTLITLKDSRKANDTDSQPPPLRGTLSLDDHMRAAKNKNGMFSLAIPNKAVSKICQLTNMVPEWTRDNSPRLKTNSVWLIPAMLL